MDAVLKNRIFPLSTMVACNILLHIGVESSADTYLGCYDEIADYQIFAHESMTTWNSLASDGCRERCRKDLIHSFAAMWGGTHCYCAQQLKEGGIVQVNDSLCYMQCPGEPAEFCGGSNASYIFSVYSVCSKGFYGRNCETYCNCKDNTSCAVHGVCPGYECAVGWKLNKTIPYIWRCSVDINECENECNSTNSINCHNCSSDLHQKCKNTKGSFTCICENGLRYLANIGSCTDVNECAINNGGCQHYCNNTIGSFACSCGPGLRIAVQIEDSYNCTDVDECAEGISNCEHHCHNLVGGYNCSCISGFQLHNDLHTCYDIDECNSGSHQCAQVCVNTIGNYSCDCHSGFLLVDRFNCHDIDECNFGSHGCGQVCVNTMGNYSCDCNSGFVLVDRFNCQIDCSSLKSGYDIGIGIQSFIIIILIATVVMLLILLKRKRTAEAKEEATELDVYTALHRKAPSASAEDQPESVYTAIVPQDQRHDGIYANTEAN